MKVTEKEKGKPVKEVHKLACMHAYVLLKFAAGGDFGIAKASGTKVDRHCLVEWCLYLKPQTSSLNPEKHGSGSSSRDAVRLAVSKASSYPGKTVL